MAALKALSRHVLLTGHSRLRHMFHQLMAAFPAVARTRPGPLPPVPDVQLPVPPALFASDATCLTAYLKEDEVNQTADWCSRAADWGHLLLDFRWRTQPAPLAALLERLLERSPDALVVGHGLYQSTRGLMMLEALRVALPGLKRLLVKLVRRGVRVVWMLEQAANPRTQFWYVVHSMDGIIVANALIQEAMLEVGVPLWSAHLPLVTDFLYRVCSGLDHADAETVFACRKDIFHVNPATDSRMVDQLLHGLLFRL